MIAMLVEGLLSTPESKISNPTAVMEIRNASNETKWNGIHYLPIINVFQIIQVCQNFHEAKILLQRGEKEILRMNY